MMKNILLVEDDANLVELLAIHLRDLDYRLVTTPSGREGLQKTTTGVFDLILLDLNLPDRDGLEVCRSIRAKNITTPILMLTARGEELDKVLGLEMGADDYLTKPFGIRELMARVKALLRRGELLKANSVTAESPPLCYGELCIDPVKKCATRNGERIELTPKEFDLLLLLAAHPGRSYSRKELLQEVWGYQFHGYEHTVTAHVNRLRTKIERNLSDPTFILTAWGTGYRFADQQTPAHGK